MEINTNQEILETLNNETENKQVNTTNSESPVGGWMDTLARGLAAAPILLEGLTGKKLPVVGGTLGELQQTISQLVFTFQQNVDKLNEALVKVVNNQNKIWQKLTSLENGANQKLFNLTNQLQKLSGFKLTQERERKSIELGTNQDNYV